MDNPIGFKVVPVALEKVGFPSVGGCHDDGITGPGWHGINQRSKGRH